MVADLLRVQALFYLANPFNALGHALLARRLDFKRQSRIDLVAAVLSAVDRSWPARSPGPASGPWSRRRRCSGTRGRSAISSRRGCGRSGRASPSPAPARCCATASPWSASRPAGSCRARPTSSSAAARSIAHRLGIYTTALFLTQILAAKFVPPLNEVAFAAYSRIQARPDMIQSAFLKSVRLIMLVALPFYFGLAVTAGPLVLACLGPKWIEAAALVPILAMAMPMMTLQILFAPASNALGRPGMAVRTGLVGAVLLPLAFLAGIQWGMHGARLGLARRHGGAARGDDRDVAAGDRHQPARPVPGGGAGPRRVGDDGRAGRGRRFAARRRDRQPAPASPRWSRSGSPLMPGCCSPSPGRSSTRCSA